MGAIPLGGTFLRRRLRGGDEVTGATLTRFYGIHIAVLPALTALLLSLHLFLVQQPGMSVPPSVERRGGGTRRMPFLPNFLLRDLVGWFSALAVLAALAAYLPAEPSPLFTWIGILLLLSMVVLTYLGYPVSPTT